MTRPEAGDASGARVRAFEPESDLDWAEALLDHEFGGRMQARRGELVDVLALPGLVAEIDGERAGLATYDAGVECELAVLVATKPRIGVGTSLLRDLRRRVGNVPIFAVTTNDNLTALAFYQRRGFRLRALRAGAVDEARMALKPAIGKVGEHASRSGTSSSWCSRPTSGAAARRRGRL